MMERVMIAGRTWIKIDTIPVCAKPVRKVTCHVLGSAKKKGMHIQIFERIKMPM
jgi:hypothetical protein